VQQSTPAAAALSEVVRLDNLLSVAKTLALSADRH
jgi:hypothetical protein